MTRMAGQSLAEFAAFAFVLVLLGAGLHVVARYQSIQRQSVLAARHAAIRMAWSPEPPLQQALQHRPQPQAPARGSYSQRRKEDDRRADVEALRH